MDAPVRFNLSGLPLRGIQTVMQHFNIPDLLSCSHTSLRLCNIARSLMYKTTSVEVFTDRKKTTLRFKNGDVDNGMLYFKKEFKWNYVTVSLDEDHQRVVYQENNTQLYTSLHSAIIYATNLLRITVSKVTICPEGLPLTTLHNLTKLKIEMCEEMEIKVEDKSKRIYFPNRVLMKVIRNICATENLHLNMLIDKKFKCEPSFFKCRQLTIGCPTPWLTGKDLFKMRCTRMKITQSRFKVEDLLSFIKKWMKSGWSERGEFEYLDIAFEKEMKELVFPVSLQEKSWNNKMRSSSYLTSDKIEVDCKDGHDVVHKDGKLMATFCLHTEKANEPKRFFFGVWHNPFPVIAKTVSENTVKNE